MALLLLLVYFQIQYCETNIDLSRLLFMASHEGPVVVITLNIFSISWELNPGISIVLVLHSINS